MRQRRYWRLIGLAFLLGGVALPQAAPGYIDPGTGSYMLQIAIAFLLGLAFSIKVFLKKIASFLRKLVSGKKGAGPDVS
jgi:hypothetical protein